jgi:hypothetical protein
MDMLGSKYIQNSRQTENQKTFLPKQEMYAIDTTGYFLPFGPPEAGWGSV